MPLKNTRRHDQAEVVSSTGREIQSAKKDGQSSSIQRRSIPQHIVAQAADALGTGVPPSVPPKPQVNNTMSPVQREDLSNGHHASQAVDTRTVHNSSRTKIGGSARQKRAPPLPPISERGAHRTHDRGPADSIRMTIDDECVMTLRLCVRRTSLIGRRQRCCVTEIKIKKGDANDKDIFQRMRNEFRRVAFRLSRWEWLTWSRASSVRLAKFIQVNGEWLPMADLEAEPLKSALLDDQFTDDNAMDGHNKDSGNTQPRRSSSTSRACLGPAYLLKCYEDPQTSVAHFVNWALFDSTWSDRRPHDNPAVHLNLAECTKCWGIEIVGEINRGLV